MRRDFMADASHELRTPVTAIQGYAETLLRGTADPATSKQFLEVIHRHAMRLGSLVDEVLRLTELEDRPPDQVRRERVDVAGVAEAVAETVRARAASEGITVTLDVPRGLEVLADPLELEQVLLNLADNAVKYGKRGGAVRIEGARDDGGVELRVVDDGPGIEARHLPRLFERFYRVDPSRSRDRGGTGLGLAIVKQLVDSMGGAVDVTSEVGRGTTFRVRLPVTA
jgi:two-component system phosphate regulon sensor histidine kinase PhoR